MWKKLSAAQRVAIVATGAAAAVWTAVWVTPSANTPQTSTEIAAPAAPAEPVVEKPALAAPRQQRPASAEREAHTVRAAPADRQPAAAEARPIDEKALAAFRAGMASDNADTRIAALRQLETDATIEALPELLQRDLTRDPEVAPTLIQVTSRLAQRSPFQERGAAAERMTSWLVNEAEGNVSSLVEALSTLNSPKTQPALLSVLQNDKLPLHVQTLAVDGLSHFANPETKAALEQFRDQLAQGKREGVELGQQREAQQATDRALARVSR